MYGHMHYTQEFEENINHNAELDVHRIVALYGYQFSRNTQFVTEIEYEHVQEVYIEQAWVKHKLSKGINLKAGLLLVPMGYINEQHEPTLFYSVERPFLDKYIVPTSWRELGLGITGLLTKQSLKYQIYLMNNVLGYDEGAKITAAKSIRAARQKGAKSTLSGLPSLSAQIEYFGISDLKIALSAFYGPTNTTYGEGREISIDGFDEQLDSTTIDLSMLSLHALYEVNNLSFRGQYSFTHFKDTETYNAFAKSDVPEMMHGFYLVMAYDFLNHSVKSLKPFVRFSHINNQLKLSKGQTENLDLKQNIFTLGLNYSPEKGLVFKTDFQFYQRAGNNNYKQLNAGIGVWF